MLGIKNLKYFQRLNAHDRPLYSTRISSTVLWLLILCIMSPLGMYRKQYSCLIQTKSASTKSNYFIHIRKTGEFFGECCEFQRIFFYPTTPLSLTTGAKGCCHMKTSLSTAINITCVATFQALLRPHLVTLFLKKLPFHCTCG